jgi:hypothetical protein
MKITYVIACPQGTHSIKDEHLPIQKTGKIPLPVFTHFKYWTSDLNKKNMYILTPAMY